jgi:hypothetical protein
MASPMVCYEIAVNGKLLSKACVGDGDQFEAALAKPVGDRDPTLSVTVFSARSPHPNKNISWATDQLEVGDEITIRVVEDEKESETFLSSNEEFETTIKRSQFCSFCGKGDREIRSMVAGKDGILFAMSASIFVPISLSRLGKWIADAG